jgi:hypothetical protein
MSGPTEEEAARERARRQKIQQQLDQALADSSPASDPVSIVTSQGEEWDNPPAAPPKEDPPTP